MKAFVSGLLVFCCCLLCACGTGTPAVEQLETVESMGFGVQALTPAPVPTPIPPDSEGVHVLYPHIINATEATPPPVEQPVIEVGEEVAADAGAYASVLAPLQTTPAPVQMTPAPEEDAPVEAAYAMEAAQELSEQEQSMLLSYMEQDEMYAHDGQQHIQVMYQSDALFSCLVATVTPNERLYYAPYTIDKHTGELLLLSDFFLDSEDTGWRFLLPEIVAETAEEANMLLLCDVQPIRDTNLFFIQRGNIVLMYRPYEITTYEIGWPCFEIPFSRISGLLRGRCGIGGT